MNRGFFSIIEKQNGKVKRDTRKTRHSPRPKKARKTKSKIKSMLITFSTFKVLCIRNFFLTDRKSTKLTIVRFLREAQKKGHSCPAGDC